MERIQAVLFDMGGTLENLYYDSRLREEATKGLRELLRALDLEPALSLPELHSAVLAGLAAYQAWRENGDIELPPERVWTEFIFAGHDLPRERLASVADELMLFYETHYYVRSLRPEAAAVLESLRRAGYRLGVISNVMSRRLVPGKLAEYGIAHYFDPVLTSVEFGRRKPNARIFEEAARLLRLSPAACAYVGDTVSRDVIGARRAHFGLVIQIKSFLTDKADRTTEPVAADAVVHDLMEVVDLVGRPVEAAYGH